MVTKYGHQKYIIKTINYDKNLILFSFNQSFCSSFFLNFNKSPTSTLSNTHNFSNVSKSIRVDWPLYNLCNVVLLIPVARTTSATFILRSAKNKPKMKVPIECPIFRAYLQKEIPAAFDSDGLMSTHHEVVKNIRRIKIVLLGASSLDGIEYLGKLRWLYIDNNPEIKHLPKLPNTLDTFYSNHKFETTLKPTSNKPTPKLIHPL